jgi:hypothetical protein
MLIEMPPTCVFGMIIQEMSRAPDSFLQGPFSDTLWRPCLAIGLVC